MIHIIITAYGEPKSTEQCINSIIKQNIKIPYKIIVSDPFTETKWMLEEKFPNNKNIEYFEDEDKGKSYALNQLLKKFYSKNKEDILIFTDGDVFLEDNSINSIIDSFKDLKIGGVCSSLISINPRNNMYGYWSHLAFDEMNKTRSKLSKENKFFELSGYLFAIRNNVIESFPTEASEDNVIPTLFWKKDYKMKYVENSKVYVLNPKNFKDWLTQKKRNIKGHIALKSQVGILDIRKNTIFHEALRGVKFLFTHPKNTKEFIWFILMAFARLYAWLIAMYEVKIKKQKYKDGWREQGETPSTSPLD
jgi:cellulose synthase/poly-beta-1,6-N-acetylglucosamine synthase-like glycosyltransferase